MKQNLKIFFTGFALFLIVPIEKALAIAVCPVCTVAVGAGVGLSRWIGIDDMISGVWIGGLTVTVIIWLLNWLKKKKIEFSFKNPTVISLTYLLLILPLYWADIMGAPFNQFCGVDKLLLGILTGSLIFWLAIKLHYKLKKKNNNKSYFPFQKVVIPVLSLVILSLIFYIITKCA
ncbi:MAG: hypothetical protein GF335_00635 [Candidatus Moranbacteria bacterium]|nr:hypothetical protein [Candidatus Moranbacteria bacterium]